MNDPRVLWFNWRYTKPDFGELCRSGVSSTGREQIIWIVGQFRHNKLDPHKIKHIIIPGKSWIWTDGVADNLWLLSEGDPNNA